ncbi:Uncharacterized conserved protein YjbJ, UPF0337 family [Faunimonas pinastri]|uniref:Uncharacterized conserved protein YjbJ, UPF0337 family n=1 Tax=Faunimonas pinastri TaxID=1855383 RepID=A0A1H9MGK9_9HYPH|nr:CsbD family protein [Faunimonas pinastri]SER22804.1 Uncharacterized conserved protein YjbJ, UPF0337 family [Faunimonas pinastri]
MVDINRVQGTAREAVGSIQEGVGSFIGDSKTQIQGKVKQFAGQAQDAYGQAADGARAVAGTISSNVERQPIPAILIAAVAGYLIGMISARR